MDRRFRISITGIVQGVGFRPHVFKLAAKLGVKGFVFNTSKGVVIEVEGEGAENFQDALLGSLPPLAKIETIESQELPPASYERFEIKLSELAENEFSLVSPDIAVCADCLREIYEPSDRRYLYPFTNCTNCGPRYSIIKGVPYDRPLTTMKKFGMCEGCLKEYEDPLDRRFHAQPIACAECGPTLKYRGQGSGASGRQDKGDDALVDAIKDIVDGKVVAVKGLGGFQLVCDAANGSAVNKLRERKRKNLKPFALMARDIYSINKYCFINEVEEHLLTAVQAPIVLMRKKPEADTLLSAAVAPGNAYLGFMLPYTPLHSLLFDHPKFDEGSLPPALVMTSGNLSEEPIVTDDDEALEKLSGLADSFLLHDREIYMRVDDSVARVVAGIPRLIRRARGYVPGAFDLGREMPEILAVGGELKNTACITKGPYAIMSQHIGDLANFEAMSFFEETIWNLRRTFKADPHIFAHDLHPDYLSTRFALDYDNVADKKLVPVQHHHAHIAACMAENGVTERVIGVAFDGTGHGTDGLTWGSEFLIADLQGFERFSRFDYVPLPGGDKAVLEPWRTALSFLIGAFGDDGLKIFRELRGGQYGSDADTVSVMVGKKINSPLSCGMGRYFDAVSALLGIKDRITFEGEAAIALEMAADKSDDQGIYDLSIEGATPAVIGSAPLFKAIVGDIRKGVSAETIARRFHNTISEAVLNMCEKARHQTQINRAVLSGGVFQNALLFESVLSKLKASGFSVITHSKVPTNDACVSLGQAAIAAALNS
jgi:hydrogenase maturation protein HypF